eukprot:jgi/Ulvmu1/10234/UM060_0035.1
MGTVHRRVGVRKAPSRAHYGSSRGRHVYVVVPDRQRTRSPTVRHSNVEDKYEDGEEILARLMPSTWRRRSARAATDADAERAGAAAAFPHASEHTFMKSLRRHIQEGVNVVDRRNLALAPADHPLRPSKHFLVVLTRRIFGRKRPQPVASPVQLPELRWAAAASRPAAPSDPPAADAGDAADSPPSLGYRGAEPLHTQKLRHRRFQTAAVSSQRSPGGRDARSNVPAHASTRSQYSTLGTSPSTDAAGAAAYIDAALKGSLSRSPQAAAAEREAKMADSISAVLHTLAPSATPEPRFSSNYTDPWHQPVAARAQTTSLPRQSPTAETPAAPAAAAAAAPAIPPPSRSAVDTLPCSNLEKRFTGLGAVDTLRSRLNRPAIPFPAQVEIDDSPPLPGMRPRSELIYDEHKEAHRSWRRYVYDFDYWAHDRSAARFFFAALHLPATRILRDVLTPTLFVAAVAAAHCSPAARAAAAGLLEQVAGMLPAAVRSVGGAMTSAVCGTPMELTAGFVGLLLAFRANNAASRFDEARKQLAMMLNTTRDSVRLAIATLPAGAVHAKASFARWVIVSFAALQCQLRIDDDLEREVDGLLTDDEQHLLFSSDHPTLMCFAVLSRMIEAADASAPQKRLLQRSITRMQDVLGGCERIMDTPIPLATMRHSSRMLMAWLTLFPIFMFPALGTNVMWVAPMAALLLFGMEEISVEIEEPFSMLSIEVISGKARSDIITLVNGQLVNDCATGTVVGNAMATPPASYLNSMERPVEPVEGAEDLGWLKPSWAAID